MEALGGSYYFMILIDDYNKRTCVYFLKTMERAFGRFKEWHAMVEKESGTKLKILRSNRVVSSHQVNLRVATRVIGSRGRNPLHIHPNKMESWRRRMTSSMEWVSVC